jgi:hypothetical protein
METRQPDCPVCGRAMEIARYRCPYCDAVLEGSFGLPPLARLSAEEQAFVTAFVRVHGNIRRMEALFAVSYPTVKNRLNAIAARLDAPMMVQGPAEVLERLARGEITADEALELLGPEP